jgi:tetratricopeptide (TPR) repeat protein
LAAGSSFYDSTHFPRKEMQSGKQIMNVPTVSISNNQDILSMAAQSEQAGNMMTAARFYRLAGEDAAEQYATQEALACFTRALEITPSVNVESRYQLQMDLEKIYSIMGNPEKRGENLASLAALADMIGSDDKRVEVAICLVDYKLTLGEYQDGIDVTRLALRIAQVSNSIFGEVALLRLWGQIYLRQGKYFQAQTKLTQAMVIAQSAALQHEEAHCCRFLGVICEEKGQPDQAKTYYDHALTIYRVLQDVRGQSDLLNNLGKVAYDQNKYSEALHYWEKAQPAYMQMGDQRGMCRLLINLSTISLDIGRFEKAQQYNEEALAVSQRIGLRFGECLAGINLALAYHYQGKQEQAKMQCQQALQMAQKLGSTQLQGICYLTLGQIYTEMAQFEDASLAFWHAFAVWNEISHKTLLAAARAGLVRLALKQGRVKEVRLHVEEIISRLKESPALEGVESPFAIYLTCYDALCALHDVRANEWLITAYVRLKKCAEAISDERMRAAYLKNVAVHHQIVSQYLTLIQP